MEPIYWVVLFATVVTAVVLAFSRAHWKNNSEGYRERLRDSHRERDRAYECAHVAETQLRDFRKLIGSLGDS